MAFDLQTVLIEKINEAHLRAYCVRFDFGECQIEALAEILMDALVDYAFGFHTGILEKYDRRILKEAATSLYKIQGYENAKIIYLDSDSVIDLNETDKTEEQIKYEKEIMKKGEFGELLLHTYLRDYFNTIPLLSKICLKDTDGFTVHGFDAIHIGKNLVDLDKDSLFLGESKIYYRSSGKSGEAGVNDLAKDIESHFYRDFLHRNECKIVHPTYSYPTKPCINLHIKHFNHTRQRHCRIVHTVYRAIRCNSRNDTPETSCTGAKTNLFTFHSSAVLRYTHCIKSWVTSHLLRYIDTYTYKECNKHHTIYAIT